MSESVKNKGAHPVLVVGSVAFDTLHMPTGSFPKVLGGSAFYASIAASYFAPVRLVGVVGDDYPSAAVDMLRSRGVDLAGLEVAKGLTFHWEGKYSADLSSRESLATDLNVFASFEPKIPTDWKKSPFVMLGNIDPTLQRHVLEQMEEKPRLVVADTMNFWIHGKREELVKTLALVDVLVVNDEEARDLSGKKNLVVAAHELQKLGPRAIIIKKGEHGGLLFDGDEIFSAAAYPLREIQDPTGAGDTFAGALIGALASAPEVTHAALRRSMVIGAALASYCVEGIGVEKMRALSDEDIKSRAGRFAQLVQFTV